MTDATITDLRYDAFDVICDMEQWHENEQQPSDDIYRILLDDSTAIDCYYDSDYTLRIEMGHVYPTPINNAVQTSFYHVRYTDCGAILKLRADGSVTEIDCKSIEAIGVIPFDMSLFGSHPRKIE